jgi:hypothetical protein
MDVQLAETAGEVALRRGLQRLILEEQPWRSATASRRPWIVRSESDRDKSIPDTIPPTAGVSGATTKSMAAVMSSSPSGVRVRSA